MEKTVYECDVCGTSCDNEDVNVLSIQTRYEQTVISLMIEAIATQEGERADLCPLCILKALEIYIKNAEEKMAEDNIYGKKI
jgi:hypothetical protein